MSKSAEAVRQAASRGYTVTDAGIVIGPRGIRRTVPTERGHHHFNVCLGKERIPIYVHKLAAFLHYGEQALQPGVEVRHVNGLAGDNRKENLLLGTRSDNALDQPVEVRKARAQHASSFLRKLSDEQVLALRADREAGATYSDLCKKYGVVKSTVSRLVREKAVS